MKIQTIARINNEGIVFQFVDSFRVVKNQNIKLLTVDERSGFADWVNSGDMIKASFDTNRLCDFEYVFQYNELSLSVQQHQCLGHYQVTQIQSETKEFLRKFNAIEKAVSDLGFTFRSIDEKLKLIILFKKLNVIGGTAVFGHQKITFDKVDFNDVFEMIAELKPPVIF
ncbi:MAG: hypothetical protein V7749_00760 [Cocleimonas sp.]